MTPIVRLAAETDAVAIAEIYNEGISERIATFETEERSGIDIKRALIEKGWRFPTVILERDSHIVAVAWSSEYRPRVCYAGVVEFSVYTRSQARGTGAGTAVMQELIRQCEARGYWKMLSRVFPENIASLSLCRKLGFREVGVYHRHGRLEGKWRDCVIVEKLLGEAARSRFDVLRY